MLVNSFAMEPCTDDITLNINKTYLHHIFIHVDFFLLSDLIIVCYDYAKFIKIEISCCFI